MKKCLYLLSCLLMLNACNDKQETSQSVETPMAQIELPEGFETMIFSFQKDTLSENCQTDSDAVCAIEKTVKCALNPIQSYCDKNAMPDFLFFDDAIFAEDNVEGRPTQQSFKLIKTKPIDKTTVEVYTEGECDSNWFGACRGNVIYVMDNSLGHWIVKEIYAVETVH